jgi:phospholipid:diacylglycerol acyltransferase
MFTHQAADGSKPVTEKAGVVCPLQLAKDETTESDAPSLNALDDEERTSCWTASRHILAFAMFVWIAQVVVAVSLSESSHWFPFSNESSYWMRLNETISLGPLMRERERPGFQLAKTGAQGQYPVVMIPGFVTSGLEVWGGKECARKYFRQRIWGGISSARQFLMDGECFIEHLGLDAESGSDPDGIRLRPAQGFEAADYFMANYWVWYKILENLADVGYDGSMMSMESYDWRLAFPVLEERDGYLTKLKYKIEAFHKATGKKVIISSHSLGGILVHYFFAWVTSSEKEGGGGGGKKWVDEHIHAYINIAGPHLGVPKAASALLSGEMSDTIILGTLGNLVEQFVGRKLRHSLWNTWGSLWTMLPKGGDALWSVRTDLNDMLSSTDSLINDSGGDGFSPMLVMTDTQSETLPEAPTCNKDNLLDPREENVVSSALKTFASQKAPSVKQTIDFLLKWGAGFGPSLSSPRLHSFDPMEKPSSRTWHDLTRTPLPYAPNMKLYCFYGVGLDTERAYFYKRNTEDGDKNENPSPPTELPFVLDTNFHYPEEKIRNGVKYVDGDASVPLLSLGYMCSDAWQRKSSGLNPSKTEVITREYNDRREFSVDDPMRGGPYSADHVDILGNIDMIEDFMKIVTDHEVDQVKDSITSDIKDMAKTINVHPNGGLYKKRFRLFRR